MKTGGKFLPADQEIAEPIHFHYKEAESLRICENNIILIYRALNSVYR